MYLDSLYHTVIRRQQLTQQYTYAKTATVKVRWYNAKHSVVMCVCFQEKYYKVCAVRAVADKNVRTPHNRAHIVYKGSSFYFNLYRSLMVGFAISLENIYNNFLFVVSNKIAYTHTLQTMHLP